MYDKIKDRRIVKRDMGDIVNLDGWEKCKINEQEVKDGIGDYPFYHYMRKMSQSKVCIKEYMSHIFICFFLNEQELMESWKKVNVYVALRVQSQIKDLIEKSNFYICFFVKEKVSTDLQEKIKGDTFCAKKHIFINENIELYECCKDIEHRIFSIQIPEKIDMSEKEKVKSVTLQNFRVFEDKKTVEFLDMNNKPASFVAIYAKNGVGKTSIFDGVEFALKGSVNRLIELNKGDEVETGAIYHNRKNKSKDASVTITLKSDRKIIRNISKVKDLEDGNDCRKNPPVQGREIVGDCPEQWDLMILPHDKIEKFISAKKPTAFYKEWIASSEILKKQSKTFIDSHKVLNDKENNLIKLQNEITELNTQLQELSQRQDINNQWRKLIMEYNLDNQNRTLDIDDDTFDEKSYDIIVNLANKYIRSIEEEFHDLEDKGKVADNVQKVGIEYYKNSINRTIEIKKQLEDINKKIDRKRQYDEFYLNLLEKYKRIKRLQSEFIHIKQIEKNGVEFIFKEKQNYVERKLEIKKLIDWKKATHKDNIILREKLLELQFNIHKSKKKLEERVVEQKLYQARKKYDEIDKEIDKIKGNIENYVVNKQKIIENEQRQKIILDKINNVYLPENLDDLQINQVSDLMQVLDIESINRLNDLQNQYAGLKEKRNVCQKRLSDTEQNQKELEQLCFDGRDYLNRHMQIKSCPLCHTPFDSWKELFERVNSVESGNLGFFQKELHDISFSLSEIADEYTVEYRKFYKVKLGKINDKKIELQEIENNKNEYEKNILKQSEILQVRQTDIYSCKQFLVSEEISFVESVDQAISLWKQEQKKKIDILCSDLEQLENREREIKSKEEKLNTLQKKQIDVEDNLELFEGINFLIDKHQGYSIQADKERINDEILVVQKERDGIQEEISKLKDMSDIELNYFIELRENQKKLLEKESLISEQCDIFPELTEKSIQESLINWKEKSKKNKKSKELLYQICSENGIRVYLEKYKESKKQLEKKVEEKEKNELDKNAYSILYEETKNELEKNLKNYFSQTFINEIYQKIDPHYFMKNIDYNISFNKDNKPQLYMQVKESTENEVKDAYRPEWFFSSAQLNTVVFSSFFSRALQTENLPIGTIFIDDPIEYFDDINMLGFADLLRSVLELSNCQIVISTHDERVFRILERKLNSKFYSSCFVRLPDDYRSSQ